MYLSVGIETYINYLMFADDLCIIAETAAELQAAINALEKYCLDNGLKINVSKTKCMVFYRGRPPSCSFTLGEASLELVNSFTYLGFNLTTQLSFSKHLEIITARANSRCGTLMARLPLQKLPLALVLRVWDCYVLPIFRYGLPLWLSSCSKSSCQTANSTFTKFLKSYLGVPYHANNAITHFLTKTCPLLNTLEKLAPHSLTSLAFPPELHGYQLCFINTMHESDPYDPIPLIPTYFWRSKMFHELPSSTHYRKLLSREIYDIDHVNFCSNLKFHLFDANHCTCVACNKKMCHYHKYFCDSFCDI